MKPKRSLITLAATYIVVVLLGATSADATFFVTGEFVRDFPQWTKAIIAWCFPSWEMKVT